MEDKVVSNKVNYKQIDVTFTIAVNSDTKQFSGSVTEIKKTVFWTPVTTAKRHILMHIHREGM